MLSVSDEHRRVFPDSSLIPFKHCKNLRDILIRAMLYSGGENNCNKSVFTPCGKPRFEVSSFKCDSIYLYFVDYNFLFTKIPSAGKRTKIRFRNLLNIVELYEYNLVK